MLFGSHKCWATGALCEVVASAGGTGEEKGGTWGGTAANYLLCENADGTGNSKCA